MGDIGSIFEEPAADDGGRGPDLHVRVEVPRAGLGQPDGVFVELAETLPHDGGEAKRARMPTDPPGGLMLHLPEGFSDGATLRLRGAGGVGPGGAGDLYVRVALVDRALEVAPEVSPASPAQPSGGSTSWVVWLVLIAGALIWAFAG